MTEKQKVGEKRKLSRKRKKDDVQKPLKKKVKFDLSASKSPSKSYSPPPVESKNDEENEEEEKIQLNLFDDADDEQNLRHDDELPIERASKKLLKKKKKQLDLSEEELKTNVVLPSTDEYLVSDDINEESAPDLQILHQKIRDSVNILHDFKNRKEPGR